MAPMPRGFGIVTHSFRRYEEDTAMPFWNRKKQEAPLDDNGWRTAPPALYSPPPPPAYSPPTPANQSLVESVPEDEPRFEPVTVHPNGDITTRFATVPEAKLAIKQARLKKREVAQERKAVNAEMAEIRANRRLQVARQGSMTRGGGTLGRTFRTFERIARDSAKASHANALAPLEAEKAALDQVTRRLDDLILQIEAYVLQHSPPK